MKNNAKYWILGLGTGLLVLGVGLVLSSETTEANGDEAPEDKTDDEKPDQNEPQKPDQQEADKNKPQRQKEQKSTQATIESALKGISLQSPGVEESVNLLATALDARPEETRAVISRFKQQSEAFIGAQRRQSAALFERLNKARQTLGTLKDVDAAFDVVGKVPFIGQIVAGVYQIARPFAEAHAEAQAQGNELFFVSNWRPGGPPVMTGWVGSGEAIAASGDYLLQDVPLLSFAAPIQIQAFIDYSLGYEAQMQALKRLTTARPFGVPVKKVEVTQTGQYQYQFNVTGSNDLSPEAVARGEVFGPTVWSPEDISATGPRGFDRSAPAAWLPAAKAEAVANGWLDPGRSPYAAG